MTAAPAPEGTPKVPTNPNRGEKPPVPTLALGTGRQMETNHLSI